MKDLSSILPTDPVTALAPTSQAGGNMMSDSKGAMTAPGSPPVDPLPPSKAQSDPKITATSSDSQPGDDGHPQPSHSYSPGRPSWVKTS